MDKEPPTRRLLQFRQFGARNEEHEEPTPATKSRRSPTPATPTAAGRAGGVLLGKPLPLHPSPSMVRMRARLGIWFGFGLYARRMGFGLYAPPLGVLAAGNLGF